MLGRIKVKTSITPSQVSLINDFTNIPVSDETNLRVII